MGFTYDLICAAENWRAEALRIAGLLDKSTEPWAKAEAKKLRGIAKEMKEFSS